MTPGSPGPKVTPADVKNYPNAPLYDLGTLRTIFLQFENADWEKELADFNNTDVEVPAIATVDGKTYPNVGVHFRGTSSYMMVPEGSKRSLNLSFDFVDKEQQLGGYRTLNLLNANDDPTFLRAVLYSEIARQYIPAPKANFVRVVINGESWGVYVNAQQFNKDFARDVLQEHERRALEGARPSRRTRRPGVYRRGRGRLQAPVRDQDEGRSEIVGGPHQALPRAERDAGRQARSGARPDLRCRRSAEVPGARQRARQQRRLLDARERLQHLSGREGPLPRDPARHERGSRRRGRSWLRTSAGIRARGTGRPRWPWRAWWARPQRAAAGRYGRTSGRGGRGMFGAPATAELDPLIGLDDTTKPLRSKLLAVPALRERYMSYVRDIAQKHLDWKTLGPRVQQLQALIAEDVKNDTRKLYSTEAFKAETDGDERSLKNFIEKRRAYLLK